MIAAAGVGGGLVVLSSWVCDDAFITLRTVESAVRGDGLVWNPGERVQAYTHPAWMLLLVASRTLIPDAYLSALILGYVCTAVAGAQLVAASRGLARGALVLFAAAMSKPLLHFATSGLENPLAHVVLLAMAREVGAGAFTVRTLRRLGVLAGVLALTRLDLLVLVAPVMLWALLGLRRAASPLALARALLPGLAIVLAWELFSLLYYGAAFPNTAYAKLGTGVPAHEMIQQGLTYLVVTAAWDPWSAVLLAVALGVALARGRAVERAWALGAFAYLAYVVWIGGDFMLGRFVTPPLAVALVLLARARFPRRRRGLLVGLVVACALALAPITRAPWDSPDRRGVGFGWGGPIDEQSFWYADTSLFWDGPENWPGEPTFPPRHRRVEMGREMERGEILVHGMIGFQGYGAEDRGVILDPMGLADPFLARLPAARDQNWRTGHASRVVPRGYVESVRHGECRMADEALCELFTHLRRVTRGPLFTRERFESIWLLNTGALTDAIDVERHRRPALVRVTEAALTRAPARFSDSGLLLTLARPRAALTLELEGGASYDVLLSLGDVERCTRRADLGARSLRLHAVSVACDEPFDRVLVQSRDRPRPRPSFGARLPSTR